MTSPANIPRPLRRALLFRAAAGDERDKILRTMFPAIDNDRTRQQLDQAQQARENVQPSQAEKIIAELIQQDQEART